jgi:hypothetical protein
MYEDFLRKKFRAEGHSIPDGYFFDHILDQRDGLFDQWFDTEKVRARCDQLSMIVASFSGILYTIARAALLVVAFTSLRSVPEELYITSWTRFMPNIS